MDLATATRRIQELSAEIEHHNHLYYVEARPVISDREFDLLLEELIRLEKQFPALKSPNSPSTGWRYHYQRIYHCRAQVPDAFAGQYLFGAGAERL